MTDSPEDGGTPGIGDSREGFAHRSGRISEHEEAEIEERERLRSVIIYEIVRDEGEQELLRPPVSLWWSAVTAGVAISASLGAQGALHHYLPDAPWRPLVEKLGYTVGFLIVVLGRLQLFTENTVTVVLPLMAEPTRRNLLLMARLWSVVFAGNVAGTFMFALAAVYLGLFPAEQVESFREVARSFMDKTALEMALLGIPAGFMIAVLVWVLPSAEGNEFWVIVTLTYFLAVGDFAHVVVGSADALLLLVSGEIGLWRTFGVFMVPTFVGNVLGGTALFAVLAYSQVRKEM